MRKINLDRYLPELSALYSFYRYSEYAFQDTDLQKHIIEQEHTSLLASALPYLTVNLNQSSEFQQQFESQIYEKVVNEIHGGLSALRRQILETAHSIFEKYLCHVVRVYLHIFPQILMDIDKQVSFRTIAELHDNEPIFDHVVEKEVSHFSRRNLQEKKDYLAKHLKHTHQEEVWAYYGEELWKDIDQKRQAIVHREETPEISHEYLLRGINCLQSIMLGMAVFAQVDQGVEFTWGVMSGYIKSKDQPTLR